MRFTSIVSVLLLCISVSLNAMAAGPEIGKAAPDFIGIDTRGNSIRLSDFKGKPVVLEWTNHECPYVKKHYNSGNMQRTQRTLTEEGAVWISIISSAKGQQGFVSAEKADKLSQSRGAYTDMVLLDSEGEIGRMYGAKTTPHMFLIDAKGILKYMGAIDDKPSARPGSLKGATNYVINAWNALRDGSDITLSNTKPYGCSVKYAH